MSHPRIEEVSDSDPDMVSDPEEMDLDDFAETDIMRRIDDKSAPAADSDDSDEEEELPPKPSQLEAIARAQSQHQAMLNPPTIKPTQDDRAVYAKFQCLYPVYFDASRSRAEGRRVSSGLAVKNPLAREIANACSRLRLQTVLEPEKTHPKDWSNPGRVKVNLRGATGNAITNKHHLYLLVAKHLAENPTTEASQGLRVRMGGQIHPPEGEAYPKPAVPRGWKMNEYVPYLSAAMTGGGVSENLFKDIMGAMQGGGDPMAALMAAQQGGAGAGPSAPAAVDEGKKKKDKKKK